VKGGESSCSYVAYLPLSMGLLALKEVIGLFDSTIIELATKLLVPMTFLTRQSTKVARHANIHYFFTRKF